SSTSSRATSGSGSAAPYRLRGAPRTARWRSPACGSSPSCASRRCEACLPSSRASPCEPCPASSCRISPFAPPRSPPSAKCRQALPSCVGKARGESPAAIWRQVRSRRRLPRNSPRAMQKQPNLLVILIDDLRFDEFGAGGHPYMLTPHVDRLAREGALGLNAFHTTPLCSPNRASIVTGQYASRHGIIDNVARDAASHRLPNYHLELQRLGYETAHVGKWHMGNDGSPRPGYDRWVSFDGHGRLFDPELNVDGQRRAVPGYVTDVLNAEAVAFVERRRAKPWSLFFAHKAVHPDAHQAADGTLDLSRGGYKPAERHRYLYRGCVFPPRPNVLPPDEVVRSKPAWAEAFRLKATDRAQAVLAAIHAGTQEEISLRAAMMASVDEGVGMLLEALERTGQLD